MRAQDPPLEDIPERYGSPDTCYYRLMLCEGRCLAQARIRKLLQDFKFGNALFGFLTVQASATLDLKVCEAVVSDDTSETVLPAARVFLSYLRSSKTPPRLWEDRSTYLRVS